MVDRFKLSVVAAVGYEQFDVLVCQDVVLRQPLTREDVVWNR